MTAQVSVRVPQGWPTRRDPGRGIVLAARAPAERWGQPLDEAPGGAGAPTVVLRVVDVPAEEDLEAWRARALQELADATDAFSLEDDDAFDLEGAPTHYHRFAHRDGFTELLTEQWCWRVDGLGVTMSCTVATEQYPLYCDLFEEIAASVQLKRNL